LSAPRALTIDSTSSTLMLSSTSSFSPELAPLLEVAPEALARVHA
jgi:hypothetical protein